MSTNNTIDVKFNCSAPAPVSGVYRYELIPAEIEGCCYIDLWYQFAMGMGDVHLLEHFNDAVYLNEGDRVILKDDKTISIKRKETKLKLVVNNG